MPNTQTKKLAHGAMMIALFAVFSAIAFYVPIISIVATLISPLPIAWYSAKYDRSWSILIGAMGCLITFFFGGLLILPFSLIFASIGVVMGEALRLKKSKSYLFMSSGVTVLITFAIQYIISLKLFEVDFIQDSMQLLRDSYERSIKFSENLTGQSPISPEDLKLMFDTMESALPSTITIGVFFLAFILISVNLPLLKRLGVEVPKFNAFKNLRLPKAILWYYLIILCINLFIGPETGTPIYVICLNLSIVLWLLLTIQGISFIHYCLDEFGISRFVKVLVTIMAIPLYSFVVLFGILDLGFDIRSFVKGKIRK